MEKKEGLKIAEKTIGIIGRYLIDRPGGLSVPIVAKDISLIAQKLEGIGMKADYDTIDGWIRTILAQPRKEVAKKS